MAGKGGGEEAVGERLEQEPRRRGWQGSGEFQSRKGGGSRRGMVAVRKGHRQVPGPCAWVQSQTVSNVYSPMSFPMPSTGCTGPSSRGGHLTASQSDLWAWAGTRASIVSSDSILSPTTANANTVTQSQANQGACRHPNSTERPQSCPLTGKSVSSPHLLCSVIS